MRRDPHAMLAEAQRAMTTAQQHLTIAAESTDEAVKRDRYKQAAGQLGHASRLLAALAEDPNPPQPRGPGLSMPGPGPRDVPVFPR
jgi:hypothetical protein